MEEAATPAALPAGVARDADGQTIMADGEALQPSADSFLDHASLSDGSAALGASPVRRPGLGALH